MIQKTMTNLIANGGFERDWEYWNINGNWNKAMIDRENSAEGGKSAKVIGNLTSQETILWYDPDNISRWREHVRSGHKYYGSYWGKNLSNVPLVTHCILLSAGSTMPSIPANTPNWTRVSEITLADNSNTNAYLATLWSTGGGNGQPYWADGFLLINLTETFGAGNEPTKEWCDKNIPYFEGTKNFILTDGAMSIAPVISPNVVHTGQAFSISVQISMGEPVPLKCVTPVSGTYISGGVALNNHIETYFY